MQFEKSFEIRKVDEAAHVVEASPQPKSRTPKTRLPITPALKARSRNGRESDGVDRCVGRR